MAVEIRTYEIMMRQFFNAMKEFEELVETKNRLRLEHERLMEACGCKICMNAVAKVAFVPCGHCYVCVSCAEKLHTCPFCRAPIEERITLKLEESAAFVYKENNDSK